MEINIVIVGIKQYFKIIDGVKTWVRDENIEINSTQNDPVAVLEQHEAIEIIANK